jgi:hypothetical protein
MRGTAVSLEGLIAHAELVGARAAQRKREQILQNANLPADINLSATEAGLELSGKGLRRRMIDDPRLRNFAR